MAFFVTFSFQNGVLRRWYCSMLQSDNISRLCCLDTDFPTPGAFSLFYFPISGVVVPKKSSEVTVVKSSRIGQLRYSSNYTRLLRINGLIYRSSFLYVWSKVYRNCHRIVGRIFWDPLGTGLFRLVEICQFISEKRQHHTLRFPIIHWTTKSDISLWL